MLQVSSYQIPAECSISLVVRTGAALLSWPAGVEDEERRHGQTIGVLRIREEHAAAERGSET